ncbi:MAG TPA: GtrA family protein [Steroidobacteraceae bacterium]|nr:GtrA family protein [Steroidobacteraceae bacterium]
MLARTWQQSQKLRFLLVGAWNTAFAYAAFASLYVLLHSFVHYLLISVMAHVLAVVNAFVCQRTLVFQHRSAWWPAFLRFNLVQAVVLAFSLTGLALLTEGLHLHPLVSQLAVTVIVVIGGYLMSRHYAFRA